MKVFIFNIYFFNMDISLIIALICLKFCMYIAKMYMEERGLIFFIQALVFVLLYVEDGN